LPQKFKFGDEALRYKFRSTGLYEDRISLYKNNRAVVCIDQPDTGALAALRTENFIRDCL
jgi:hypothetical protein